MTNDAFVSPLLFAVVATITPGGATTLVTASGAHFGFRRSVPLIAGIAIGLATLAAAAAAGLAGLLLAIPSLQLIVMGRGTRKRMPGQPRCCGERTVSACRLAASPRRREAWGILTRP
ncbi:hypothetical protein [Streptomyces sp. NPDC005407]|uniref:hypothetical protein n=1 Tax=Streptomyces sp. NPDC005407 TaxID=3155340 RepID=UPI0033A7EFD0